MHWSACRKGAELDSGAAGVTDKRLCLALDVPDLKSAQSLIEQTAHVFGVYKIGLELFALKVQAL